MANCMAFPETFDEFAECFGFVDSKEYYTNGAELIPVFRVKQWIEYESARQKAEIERLKTLAELGNMRANDYRVMRDRDLKAEAEVDRLSQIVLYHDGHIADAIKEFAERLKAECRQDRYAIQTSTKFGVVDKKYLRVVDESDIDNLVKEMVGDTE